MEVASADVPNGATTSNQMVPLCDPDVLVNYLVEVLHANLGAQKSELESAGSLLSKARYNETVQRLMRFTSEPQPRLFVQKDLVPSNEADGAEDDTCMCSAQMAHSLC